jgi:hypothetical protein
MQRQIGIFLVLVMTHVSAIAQDHAVSAKAGLLGLGVEYSYSLNERIAFRGALYGSSLSFDGEESGIDYEFDLDWDSITVGFDLHPFTGPFRVSFGVMKNDNGLHATSMPADDVVIGDTTYSPDEVGSLNGEIGFDGTAPFLGLGWDWSKSKRFGVSLDLGLVKQGTPNVLLTADGLLDDDPTFSADLEAEEAELRDALDDLDLVPFASFGLSFRF